MVGIHMNIIQTGEPIDWENLALTNSCFISGIINNKYIPHKPFKNQFKFLLYPCEEMLYGGAAGGRQE